MFARDTDGFWAFSPAAQQAPPPSSDKLMCVALQIRVMNWRPAAVYLVLAVVALAMLQIAVSLILGILGTALAILTAVVGIAVVGVFLYGGYKAFSWARSAKRPKLPQLSRGGSSESVESINRVDRLKQRYADGELSEDEFERRLERELDGPQLEHLSHERHTERE